MKRRSHFAACAHLAGLAMLCALTARASGADLRVPPVVEAGAGFSFAVEGSGQATLYLIGPDYVAKRTVTLGSELQIQSSEVQAAGRYHVMICDSSCNSAIFEVKAASASRLSFFLHPSRVPVSTAGSIDATAFAFDKYFNLVLTPVTVDFRIAPASGEGLSRQASTHDGVAWIRMSSTPHEGAVRVTAVLGKVEEARMIQQVAAEACTLQVKAIPSGKEMILETDPVRDCSGNALPDGTVVSFTKIDRGGKSTVDTPIKKGIARTQFRVNGPARISVACGVMLGNELAVSGSL